LQPARKEIEADEIAKACCVFTSLWTEVSRLYVMAEYDRPSVGAIHKHLVQDNLQRGVKPRGFDQAEKSKGVAAHYQYGVT
jgi:hypothetical protein